jgi:hypothetical protein
MISDIIYVEVSKDWYIPHLLVVIIQAHGYRYGNSQWSWIIWLKCAIGCKMYSLNGKAVSVDLIVG